MKPNIRENAFFQLPGGRVVIIDMIRDAVAYYRITDSDGGLVAAQRSPVAELRRALAEVSP